jgi:type I restriction enzyme, S subunit
MRRLKPLGELLSQIKRPMKLVKDQSYTNLGVKWYALGLFSKEAQLGGQIKAKTLFQVKEGDFIYNRLFAWKGAFALVGKEHDGLFVSGEFPTFQVKDKLNSSYLKWFFSLPNIWENISAKSSGTSQTSRLRLKERDFLEIRIPLPSLSEQAHIVYLLNEADSLRQFRSQANARMEDFVPALFHELFGNPETNEMGWDFKAIKDIGIITTGNTPSTKKRRYYGEEIEWIKSNNINTPSIILTPAKDYLSKEGKMVGRVVPVGSVLVTCIAGNSSTIGNAAIADREVAFNQQINAITPYEFIDTYFLHSQIMALREKIKGLSSGGMKGIVSKGTFEKIRVIIPPIELQRVFARRVRETRDVQSEQARSLERIEALYQSMLNKAFAGEV